MEERAGNYKEYIQHFHLGESHLRKIHAVMEEYARKIDHAAYVSIYIERENDSFFETLDLEKILAEENSGTKALKTLSMSIKVPSVANEEKKLSEDSDSKAVIGFTKEKEPKIRCMTAHNSRDWCFLLIDELDTQIQRVAKEKPTSIFKAKAVDLIFALSILTLLVTAIALNIDDSPINVKELLKGDITQKINYLVEQSANKQKIAYVWFLPGMAGSMLFFLFALEFKPITKLVKISNMSVFYWGDMISVYDSYLQKKIRIKWGVIIAFAVSLAATLIGALLV